MPVIRNMPVKITIDEVLKRQTKKEPTPSILAMAEWAIARARELIEPASVYAVYATEGIEGEDLVLEGGKRLKLGPNASLVAPAERVIISVTTIGPRLEAEVRQLMAGPDVMKGYLLDCAGVVSVGQAGLAIRELAEEMARAEDWGVGPSVYPGSPMGWAVRGQRELLSLVDVEQIGVSLTSSCMMVPQKSSSGMIGIGAGYDESQVGTLCHWCSLQDSCWRRREKVEAQG